MSAVAEHRPDSVEAAPGAATMCEAFQAVARRYAGQVALRTADGSLEITFAEYAERIRRITAGLAALGVRRGDTVGLMMSNRPEFHLCDTAAFHLGATPFSLYNTLARDQLAHVLDNAQARVVIAEPEYLDRLRAARGESGEPSVLVDVQSLSELEQRGDPDFDFERAWRAVQPDDVLDNARASAALYVGGMGARGKNFYNEIVSRAGFADAARTIQDHYLDGRKDQAAAAVPRELLDRLHLVGPAGHIRERVAAFRAAGVTTLMVEPVGEDPVRTIERLREIVDEFG